MPAIHKFTYPNGKIYVGRDLINPIQADTTDQMLDFNVRKETLWEDAAAQSPEVSRRQTEFIRKYHANDPAIGYNRWPEFKPGH